MGGTLIKTDLGHGRGWAAPGPAASILRIDAQLGRIADINEAGRSPEQADKNRAEWLAYERYLNGGPWAPKASYALGSDESVHCWGYAADSDDWYDARAAAVWRDNGWRQTARYPGNPKKDEPWHGEYDEKNDNHKNDPAGGGSVAPVPEEFPMFDTLYVKQIDGGKPGQGRVFAIFRDPRSGEMVKEHVKSPALANVIGVALARRGVSVATEDMKVVELDKIPNWKK